MAGDPYQVIGPTGVGMVSIRARHRWRAIPDSPERARSRFFCFNPRPPSMAGDPVVGDYMLALAYAFQSAPAIDGGRSPVCSVKHRPRCAVSIRARHRWRAIPRCPGRGAARCGRFNPRPPSMAGDPSARSLDPSLLRSFNPRPPSMAGDPRVKQGLIEGMA